MASSKRLFVIVFSVGIPLSSYYIYSRKNRIGLLRLQRQRGALIGGLVADAATRPLHWVYNDADMQKAIHDANGNKLSDFTFLPVSKSPFYCMPTGASSCYGDEFMVTLHSVYNNKHKFDLSHFKETMYQTFSGETNPYQKGLILRSKKVYPVNAPWLHSSIIDYMQNYKENKVKTGTNSHFDNDGVMAALSFTVIAANTDNNFDSFPKDQIRQIIECVVADPNVIDRGIFLCQILWNVLLRDETDNNNLPLLIAQSIQSCDNQIVVDEVKMVFRDCGYVILDDFSMKSEESLKKNLSQKDILTMDPYSKACPNPGSFMGALYNIIQNGDDYKQGILDEIEGGGDNCSRALIDGCILGAYNGENAIPKEWIAKTAKMQNKEIKQMMKATIRTVFMYRYQSQNVDGPCKVRVEIHLAMQSNECYASHRIQRRAHSLCASPTKSFLISPLKQPCLLSLSGIQSPLRFTTNRIQSSLDSYLWNGLSKQQICAVSIPSDYSSNSIFTFLMSELNTIDEVINLLKHRGIHIIKDCKFWINSSVNSENRVRRNFYILLNEAKNETLGSFLYFNQCNEYLLKIYFDRKQWRTNLEIAIQSEDINSIYCIVSNSNGQFFEFEQFMTQSVEEAVRYDKSLCLHSVFKAANICNEFIQKNKKYEAIKCFIYYFGKCLKHKSKNCIKLMLWIWLKHIEESLDECGIFQRFISKIIGHQNEEEESYDENMEFVQWLSSIIEPSLLSDSIFFAFDNDDLSYSHTIGRKKRYDVITESVLKSIGINGIAMIILNFDGYKNGKSEEISL